MRKIALPCDFLRWQIQPVRKARTPSLSLSGPAVKMKDANWALLLLFLLLFSVFGVSTMQAQTTHTFTFGKFGIDSYTGQVNGCAEFQTIDGQPANQATGYAGMICVPYNENPWWRLEAPQAWGFPNNGGDALSPQLSAPVFTQPGCNLKTDGCIDYEQATAALTGYAAGITVEVTVWFQVHKHSHFGRGCYPCVSYTNDETNGNGTATY